VVITLSCDSRWFFAYRNTCDVLVVDNYPYRGSSRTRRAITETYDWVRQGVEAMQGKAVWLMPQLIPPSHWSRNPEDELSLTDLRQQHYVGLIAGAKGVIMYSESSFTRVYLRDAEGSATSQKASAEVMARRWADVTAVVAELKTLASILTEGRPTREVELRWLDPGPYGPGPQMTRELDYYGDKYLLVANPLGVPISGQAWGINGGNRRAYDVTVFAGQDDLKVAAEKPGEPVLTVGPRGCGVFLLKRRPIAATP
jgi:hypothetical protein